MSEMTERVVQAIKDRLVDDDEVYFRDDGGTVLIDGHVNLTALARTMIRAMREPTEVMLDAGVTADFGKTLGERVINSHKAMIDAELAASEK